MFTEPQDVFSDASNSPLSSLPPSFTKSLIVVDSAVSLSAQQLSNLAATGAELIDLDAQQDGIEQLSQILSTRQQLDTLHIFSHGSEGTLSLGNRELNRETLDDYEDELIGWAGVFTDSADILLYGCETGKGETGIQFLEDLSKLTGADISASDDLTGNARLEGDWDLERQVGHIEATPLMLADFAGVLADVNPNQQVLRVNFNQVDANNSFVALDTSNSAIANNATLRPGTGSTFRQDPDGFQNGIVQLTGGQSGLDIANSSEINGAAYAKRSVVVNFKVDDKNAGRQVIYEEGGGARGLNIYLDNGQLYVGGWNRTGRDWNGTYLSTNNIENGRWHQVVLRLNAAAGQASPQANAFQAYLDGDRFAQGAATELLRHDNGIGLGNIKGNTRFHDVVQSGNLGFDGSIGDVQIYNRALTNTEITTLATGFQSTEPSEPGRGQLNANPGFEGNIRPNGTPAGWYARLSGTAGNPNTGGEIRVIDDPAVAGNSLLYLNLPEAATVNYRDQLNLQQYHDLRADKIYRVEAKVKWLNSQDSPLDTAIVSFWSQTPDGVRFGNDFFLEKAAGNQADQFQTIRYEFSPTSQNFQPNGQITIPNGEPTGTNSVVWLGVYPHLDGAAETELHVDDFRIIEVGDVTPEDDPENGNKISDPGFTTPISGNGAWKPIGYNPRNLAFDRRREGQRLRLELPGGSGNLSDPNQQDLNRAFIGVEQTVSLKQWATYELSFDVNRVEADRLDDLSLLNVYLIRTNKDPLLSSQTPNERLGPIDYDFECQSDGGCKSGTHRVTYTFRPSQSTDYDLTFRVFGFGNEGNGLKVDIDNIKLVEIEP